jgi:N-acetylmuramoyl-L-alanine amidase
MNRVMNQVMKKWAGFRTLRPISRPTALSWSPFVLAATLCGAMASAVHADESITSIRVAPSAGNMRVVFDLSGPASYKLFTLDNPSRVVLDFSDTQSLAGNVGIPAEAVVTNVRSAVQSNNALRMVLDLKQSASAKGFVLPPDGQAGHRLVVDIAHPGMAAQKNGVNTPAATPAVGAAHIYGGSPARNGQSVAGTPGGVPVVNRPAAPAAVAYSAPKPVNTASGGAASGNAPSEADVAAIKALLEQSGGPFSAPSVPASKPAVAARAPANVTKPAPVTVGQASGTPAPVAQNVSGLIDPVPVVNATPPDVVAAKPLHAGVSAPVTSNPQAVAAPVKPAVTNAVPVASKMPVASTIQVISKPAPVVAAAPSKPAPAPVKTMTLARPGKLRDVIVAIDAGHGGQDPGATGPSGIREKNVTLAIARVLQAELSKQEGVEAKLVRTGDYFIPLASRRDIARTRLKADLFVSIHADAALARKAKGASVFALSRNGATSSLAAMLADRENQADLVGGALEDKDKMVASVIADLALEGAMEHSMKVGSTVLRHLGNTTPLHKRYIEKAGFAVLKSADFPSILVETGFISNPQEEANLRSQAHQQKLARAITRGVMDYFSGNPPPGTYLAWKRDKAASTLAYADAEKNRPGNARAKD